jgi:hypothetical protein
MKRFRIHRSVTIALYVNAAVLVAILLVLLGRDGSPGILATARAQSQLPIGGGAGVFVVPAQFGPSFYGCYLLDVDAQTLCAYQYFGGNEKQLRLLAARNIRWDRRLTNLNTDPAPDEIRKIVELGQQSNRVTDRNTEKAPAEAPAKDN